MLLFSDRNELIFIAEQDKLLESPEKPIGLSLTLSQEKENLNFMEVYYIMNIMMSNSSQVK